MLATTAVIGHRVYRVPMEIGTTKFPTRAPSVRAQEECSFCRSHQQKKISLPDVNVLHIVQDGSSGCALIGRWAQWKRLQQTERLPKLPAPHSRVDISEWAPSSGSAG